jgi:hypothetical protein
LEKLRISDELAREVKLGMHLSALRVEVDVIASFRCLPGTVFPGFPVSWTRLDELEYAHLPVVSEVAVHDMAEP